MIRRWDIITIGNLSRNRYWGEAEDKPVRPALCTSTLITGEDFRLLVDPPYADGEPMALELNRRTGLRLDDITDVFVTHHHGDHTAGLWHFGRANWWAASEVAERVNASGKLAKPVQPAGERICGDVSVIATPGHTLDHHSLLFAAAAGRVVIAGDAVMTRDFWRDRRGYHNSVDFDLVAATMDHLAETADVIVPGHDNYFAARPEAPER